MSRTRSDTAGPNSRVTGARGRAAPRIEVFAIRFTPCGTFNWSAKNGLSPWLRTRAPWLSTHSKKIWSCLLSRSSRPVGWTHIPANR